MKFNSKMFTDVIPNYTDTLEQNELVNKYWMQTGFLEVDHILSDSELEDLKTLFKNTVSLYSLSYHKNVTIDEVIRINNAMKESSNERTANEVLSVNQFIEKRLDKSEEEKLKDISIPENGVISIKTPLLAKATNLETYIGYVEIKNELSEFYTEAELSPLEKYVGTYESMIEEFKETDENKIEESDPITVLKEKKGNDMGLNSLLSDLMRNLGMDSRVIEKDAEFGIYVMMTDPKYGINNKMLRSDVTADISIKNRYDFKRTHFACDIDSGLYEAVLENFKYKIKDRKMSKGLSNLLLKPNEDVKGNEFEDLINSFEKALTEDDENSLVHARMIVNNDTLNYSLEVLDNKTKKSEVKDHGIFKYDDKTKNMFINPMLNTFAKDGYVVTSNVINNSNGSTYIGQNHKDNVFSLSNVQYNYANSVNNKISESNKEIDLGQKTYTSTYAKPKTLEKVYPGFISVIFLSSIVGFSIGTIVAFLI